MKTEIESKESIGERGLVLKLLHVADYCVKGKRKTCQKTPLSEIPQILI